MTTIRIATAQGLHTFIDGVPTPAVLNGVDVTAIDTCDGELWAIVD